MKKTDIMKITTTNRMLDLLHSVIRDASRNALTTEVSNVLMANKMEVDKAIQVLNDKRTICVLMNEGQEQIIPNRGTIYVPLPYPVRKSATGKDESFAKEMLRVQKVRAKYFKEYNDLNGATVDLELSVQLTDKQFDILVDAIDSVEIEGLRNVLVK